MPPKEPDIVARYRRFAEEHGEAPRERGSGSSLAVLVRQKIAAGKLNSKEVEEIDRLKAALPARASLEECDAAPADPLVHQKVAEEPPLANPVADGIANLVAALAMHDADNPPVATAAVAARMLEEPPPVDEVLSPTESIDIDLALRASTARPQRPKPPSGKMWEKAKRQAALASSGGGAAPSGAGPSPQSCTERLCLRGVNVHHPFSQLLMQGVKTIEARGYPLGHRQIAAAGEELFLIETPPKKANVALLGDAPLPPKPKEARIVGTITFSGDKRYKTPAEFRRDAAAHRIKEGAEGYDWTGEEDMYGWHVAKVRPCRPIVDFGTQSQTGFAPRAVDIEFLSATPDEEHELPAQSTGPGAKRERSSCSAVIGDVTVIGRSGATLGGRESEGASASSCDGARKRLRWKQTVPERPPPATGHTEGAGDPSPGTLQDSIGGTCKYIMFLIHIYIWM